MADQNLVSGIDRLVLVGGSLGAVRVAEEARRLGFEGAITIVGDEPHPPYDRPPLTKEFLTCEEEPEPTHHLADPDAVGITLMTGTTAHSLDTRNRLVRTDKGDVAYDRLVIATGAQPRPLDVPGADLAGVRTIRSLEDARAVRAALQPGLRVVVVGAGFIGGEIAASARARGAEVTLVEVAPLPLVGAVGSLVAERLAYLHRQYDVDLLVRIKVRAITGSNGHVEKVRLNDGTSLAADLVIIGIGVDPATDWLRGSGVAVGDGVACSPYLESTVPGVYAVGDVARWVNQWNGRSSRLEHWTATAEQAVFVARNALTEDREACAIMPYFWSEWYGHKLQMIGEPADEVELLGDGGATDPFLAQYRYDGVLVGAFALDRTGPLMKLRVPVRKRQSWQDMLRDPTPQPRAAR